MTKLTAAQVWYITRVYPETVTEAEVIEDYDKEVTTEADRSYWEATANILNKLVAMP
ncbi:MAG TPA: hypothetical protein VFK47_23655 [Ktedonobacteraceae bacterium]|nr:hypothetical protein [Ktedonobacteraceae bacterium]